MSVSERVPFDAALPGLRTLFDADGMSRRFAHHFDSLPGVPPAVLGCEIERTKYRPGRNCVVAYRVRTRRRAGAPARWIRLCVALHAEDEGRRRFESARSTWAAGEGAFGPACSWLVDPGALLWQFPFDRKLAALGELADADWLREIALPPVAAARFGAEWRVAGARVQGIAYFPEHSYTVRTKAHLRTADGTRRRVWTCYAKIRDDESGARCHAAMQALAASEACRRGELGMATPLAYDAGRRILWQEGIDAPTLEACRSAPGMRIPWHRVGAAVAGLHRQPLGLPARLSRLGLLDELERARQRVGAVVPHVVPTLDALVRRLEGAAPTLGDEPTATVHGDLHARNVLIGADRAFLIDLDRVSTGSPLADLGSLLAEVAFRDCLAGRAASVDVYRALLAAYEDRVPWAIEPRSLAWHTAAALVRERAHRCVGSLKSGRLAALPAVLDCAARVLDDGVPGRPVRRRAKATAAPASSLRMRFEGA